MADLKLIEFNTESRVIESELAKLGTAFTFVVPCCEGQREQDAIYGYCDYKIGQHSIFATLKVNDSLLSIRIVITQDFIHDMRGNWQQWVIKSLEQELSGQLLYGKYTMIDGQLVSSAVPTILGFPVYKEEKHE